MRLPWTTGRSRQMVLATLQKKAAKEASPGICLFWLPLLISKSPRLFTNVSRRIVSLSSSGILTVLAMKSLYLSSFFCATVIL